MKKNLFFFACLFFLLSNIPISLSMPSISLKKEGQKNPFCQESSSWAKENRFYACGHAIENSLTLAREHSLKAAQKEFHSFC